MPKKWIIPPPATQCETFARQWRVPPVVAQLLINRGLSPDQPCDAFLAPQLRDIYPPELLPGVTEAARRIADRNQPCRRIDWQFRTPEVRIKLRHFHLQIQLN
ncbi:MAG: hypothetical protein Q7R41_03670 [Phycisphaerales bacterium]|nr:hypothetical protein [Phycisphaerales bacterium]